MSASGRLASALQRDELATPVHHYCLSCGAATASTTPGAGPSQATALRSEYADASYWEKRFHHTEGVFDWYATWQELGPVFREVCPASPELRVLNVGCGNSTLSAEMCRAGYTNMVNVDIAASAVEKMEREFHDLGMEWRVMDATAMEFEASRFDLCVDKGTLDAMMSSPGGESTVEAMVAEVWRTLQPGGHFMLVSHSANRRALLDKGCSGCASTWDLVELRRCRLSPQVTMINILRSKLQGRPLSEAFTDVALLREATAEAKEATKQMQLLDTFRCFRAKKERLAAAAASRRGEAPEEKVAAAASASQGADGGEEDAEAAEPQDPRLQPFCWVYVLRKSLEAA